MGSGVTSQGQFMENKREQIMPNDQQIVRLKVSAKVDYLSDIVEFAGKTVIKLGLSEPESRKLQLVTEEACLNVIEHAFDPEEAGQYEVIIERPAGQVVIAVEDQGLPFDFTKFKPDDDAGLGMLLMRAFVDEIKFLNIGRGGKRVELIKHTVG